MMIANAQEFVALTAFFFLALGVLVPTSEAQNFVPYIVGGGDVNPGDYPYYVQTINGDCGGTLIAPDIVLTAAHCGDMTNMQLSVGAYKRGRADAGAQGRFCQEWVRHPDYRADWQDYDYALCKLDKPVAVDPSKPQIVLNDDFDFPSPGTNLTIIGMGRKKGTDVQLSDTLQDVIVPSQSVDECMRAWITNYTDRMMCAGYPDDYTGEHRDACIGDSGGAVLSRTVNADGTIVDTHVGLVSFGSPCANPGIYTVHARTSEGVGWIKETMCGALGSTDPSCVGNPPYSNECQEGETMVTIGLQTDAWPEENTMLLSDDSDNIVVDRHSFFIENYKTTTDLCLDSNECFTLRIFDSYKDGIKDKNGDGIKDIDSEDEIIYEIELDGETVFEATGDFVSKVEKRFCTFPTASPSTSPAPTISSSPSASPSKSPTNAPTTKSPTGTPSASPTTKSPTATPTKVPSGVPSVSPTAAPSIKLTTKPTTIPTESPTTKNPTTIPTESPTTKNPTTIPTESPTTKHPTSIPTGSPTTKHPTSIPTGSPTTKNPTSIPTESPTTKNPTANPTDSPIEPPSSSRPTDIPTLSPTANPTPHPTDKTPYNNNECPDDLKLITQTGVVALPDNLVEIRSQDFNTVTVRMHQLFTGPSSDIDHLFYQYSKSYYDQTCLEVRDVSGDDFVETTIQCTATTKIALLELWVADGIDKNILSADDNAVVPRCCHPPEDLDGKGVTKVMFQIACVTKCPEAAE